MAGIQVVKSGEATAPSSVINFQALIASLDEGLVGCQSATDLSALVDRIKAVSRNSYLTSSQRQVISRIRQRIYDRKRRSGEPSSSRSGKCQTPVARLLLPDLAEASDALQGNLKKDLARSGSTPVPDVARSPNLAATPCQISGKLTVPDLAEPTEALQGNQQLASARSGSTPLPDFARSLESPDLADAPNQIPSPEPVNQPKEKCMLTIQAAPVSTRAEAEPPQHQSFTAGVGRAIARIDGEAFAIAAARLAIPAALTAAVIYFLWAQSVELYAASGFVNPQTAAVGGLIMLIGFAALHSARRSKLALLCCLYAGGFEAYFMTAGTVAGEHRSKIQDPALQVQAEWLREEVRRTKADYEQKKTRLADPSGKVFENSWFKTKVVDPAWAAYSDAQRKLAEHGTVIESKAAFDHVGWLKLLYRLGLVLLCMLLVHRLTSDRRKFLIKP